MAAPHRTTPPFRLTTVLLLVASAFAACTRGNHRDQADGESASSLAQSQAPSTTGPAPVDPRRAQDSRWQELTKRDKGALPSKRSGSDDHQKPSDSEAEEDNPHRLARSAWIDQMHRTPPGTSWRTIERHNRDRERLRRNRLTRAQWGDQNLQTLARQMQAGGLPSVGASQITPIGPLGEAGASRPIPSVGYWEEVGSRNQAGHTRCGVLGSPDNNDHRSLFLGSASGGLWRGSQVGEDWTPISDGIFGGADELLALPGASPQDVDILVFRQGDRIFRSNDSGMTWTSSTGLEDVLELLTVQRLFDGSGTLIALARLPGIGQGAQTWVLRSQDSGQSFEALWQAPEHGRGDLWTPQSGPGAGLEVYLALNGRLYRSADGAASFLPQVNCMVGATDSHLSGSEQGGITLYAVFESQGSWNLFRSDDAGTSCVSLGALPDYWGSRRSLVGFSSSASTVVYGGINAYRSSDSGATFQMINHWGEYYADPENKLHADIRGLDVQQIDVNGIAKDHLFLHTDGGTYVSVNAGLTVQNLCMDGLGVGQFYSTLTSNVDPNRIAAGTQDQGFQLGTRAGYFTKGPSTSFSQEISGDYGHLVSGDGSHELLFGVYPGVASSPNPGFFLVQEGAASPTWTTVAFPSANDSLWLPPIVADPAQPEAFYFLADQLWRGERIAAQWTFSPHSTQDFSSGASRYLSALDISPANPSRMVATTDAGVLWWSVDTGSTWTQASVPGPNGHYFYGSRVLAHPTDEHWWIAAGSGYGNPGVMVSFDGGDQWQTLGDDLPTTLFYDIEWSPEGNGDLYAATEMGAFRYVAALDRWENLMGLEAPSTLYWSVEAVPASYRMRFGTHGRGIWDYVFALPERAIGDSLCESAVPNSTLVAGKLEVIGVPLAGNRVLELQATQLPPGEMGYFMIANQATEPYTPLWTDGLLCLAAGYESFDFQSTGPGGNLSTTLDLQALPTMSADPVLAGQTWYFQAWHTDFVMEPTGNLTQAVGVHFH